jgi:acyl-CoA thioester hydrolase
MNETAPALPWLLTPQHVLTLNVRDADIDDFNHVNNVVYLGWMARAAWDHSKALGFDFAAYRARDCGFVVTRHEIDYKAAALAGETVYIATWISMNDGRLRLRRRFQMLAANGRELARGMSDFAAMKISSGRAMRMPADYATGYPVDTAAEAVFS